MNLSKCRKCSKHYEFDGVINCMVPLRSMKVIYVISCEESRSDNNMCGKKARWFEQKEKQ